MNCRKQVRFNLSCLLTLFATWGCNLSGNNATPTLVDLSLNQSKPPSVIATPTPNPTPTPTSTPTPVPTPAPTSTPIPTPTPPTSNALSPLGINLAGVVDWTTEWVFVDVFKTARDWISNPANGGSWGSGGPFAGFTVDGYPLLNPGQYADTPVCTGGHCPAGDYHLYYDGNGTITLWGAVSLVSQQPGQAVYHLTGDGVFVRLIATNPANPIRNIRLIMPGFESTYLTQLFHPTFLATWAKMKLLRYMDFQKTNGSTQTNWSDRATPGYFSQGTDKGVSVEYMVELANTLKADPWFCMPHLATDNYVTQFATYVRDHLDPNLKAYIEYSNEVWNGQFPQASYAQQQGLAQGLSTNAFEAQLRYQSKRSVQIFNLWTQVFGGNARLVRVLAAQAANSWTGTTLMDFQNAYQQTDTLAIAPYIGGSLGSAQTQNQIAQWSVDQVIAYLQTTEIPLANGWIAAHATEAQNRGLTLIAYEGGQHLVGVGGAENNQALTNLFQATNRDPRIKDIYLAYLAGWKSHGGTLFANFSSIGEYSKWGSWGVLEYQDQNPLTAPKYQGLLDFITQNPKWW